MLPPRRVASRFISRFTRVSAAAPPWSIVLGFGVSTAVGLVFGLWPALKTARQDPVEALRYE